MDQVGHFIIGGAPRCGTTWLCHALDRHPDVAMAKPFIPEPKFFHIDGLYARGMEYYRQTWFSEAAPGMACGEKTSYYLENPQCADRIARHLPEARLLFTLRDPVERAYSNYVWSRMNGHETEDFETALALEEERERALPESLRFVHPHAYFSRGLYARLLAPYFERFPRERILCLRLEDIRCDPAAVLAQVHAFLGLAPRPGDAEGLGRINPSCRDDRPPFPEAARKRLTTGYAGPNRELAALLGGEFAAW